MILAFCYSIIQKQFVGRAGFEPAKAYANGVTVRSIWPLWNLPDFTDLSQVRKTFPKSARP